MIGGDQFRLIRVILGDVGGEVDLAERTSLHLAHFPDDDGGQFLSTFRDGSSAARRTIPGPLGDRESPPGLESRLGRPRGSDRLGHR